MRTSVHYTLYALTSDSHAAADGQIFQLQKMQADATKT
jgi:hypothetical protein